MGDNPHLRPGPLRGARSVEGADEVGIDASEPGLGEGAGQGARALDVVVVVECVLANLAGDPHAGRCQECVAWDDRKADRLGRQYVQASARGGQTSWRRRATLTPHIPRSRRRTLDSRSVDEF